MPLPFVFPQANGPGRFTELVVLKKDNVDPLKYQEALSSALQLTSTFPTFKLARLGDSDQGKDVLALLYDWTSKEEKEKFEKDPKNASFKAASQAWGKIVDTQNAPPVRYSVNLPGSAITPKCGYYEITILKIPSAEKQLLFATTMEKFANALPHLFNYVGLGTSIEKPDDVVLIIGFPDKASAVYVDKSQEHLDAREVNDPIVEHWIKHRSTLEQTITKT